MATKSLPHVKKIFTGSVLHVRHTPIGVLKRDIHFMKNFLEEKENVSRAMKLLVGTACLTLGGYFLVNKRNKAFKKAIELKMTELRKNCNFIADLVEVVADAVVHITVFDKALHPNVKGGSGFIIESDGLIITNAHVVGNDYKRKVQITLRNGRIFIGVVVLVDEITDLALIRINCNRLPVLKLGSTNGLRPGEWVAAIGSPYFLSNSVTAGVVSAVHRGAAEIGMPFRNMNYIQTDTAIVSGNSGGPLVNLNGEVIGVNTMTFAAGISFAIPVEYVTLFLQKYKSKYEPGKSKYYIGISYFPLGPIIFEQLLWMGVLLPQSLTHGMYVWHVEPASPAFTSGIRPGDVLLEAEGENIYTINCLYNKFKRKDTVTVKFYRKGIYYETKLTAKKM